MTRENPCTANGRNLTRVDARSTTPSISQFIQCDSQHFIELLVRYGLAQCIRRGVLKVRRNLSVFAPTARLQTDRQTQIHLVGWFIAPGMRVFSNARARWCGSDRAGHEPLTASTGGYSACYGGAIGSAATFKKFPLRMSSINDAAIVHVAM